MVLRDVEMRPFILSGVVLQMSPVIDQIIVFPRNIYLSGVLDSALVNTGKY